MLGLSLHQKAKKGSLSKLLAQVGKPRSKVGCDWAGEAYIQLVLQAKELPFFSLTSFGRVNAEGENVRYYEGKDPLLTTEEIREGYKGCYEIAGEGEEEIEKALNRVDYAYYAQEFWAYRRLIAEKEGQELVAILGAALEGNPIGEYRLHNLTNKYKGLGESLMGMGWLFE